MPRLLSLNTYYYRRGGSDAVFFDHDRLFRDQGWETAPFAMHHPRNESSEWSEFFIDELEFGEAYGKWQKLVMASKVIYSWEAKGKISKLIEKFRPDVAHAHCIYHHLSPSVLVELKQRNIPTVLTAHDLKLACPAYKMLNRNGICEKCINGNLLHVVSNRCIHESLSASLLVALESSVHKSLGLYKNNLDKVVAPSKFFLQKLTEWGWPEDQLTYIPNFIDASRYTENLSNDNYFLYFGRLAPEKGVDTLIRAAKLAGCKLLIAGTGPYESRLRAVADGENNIEFLGFQSGENLWSLVRNARAIVLPSQWYENAPMSVLEAYASGKPVIGARIGGIPEMLKDGETGLLFSSGDAEDLATALTKLQLMSSADLAEMGSTARKYVSTVFTPERYTSDTLALYESLGVQRA